MKNVIIAIDYVEQGLVRAVKRLSEKMDIEIEPIVLVDKKFKDFEDYKRSDRDYFKEIVCDFDDSLELQKTLKPYMYKTLAVSCRNDAAIQDYVKAIPYMPYVDTPTESSLIWATEKRLMRDRLFGYDPELVPKYQKLVQSEMKDLNKKIEGMSFPLIVKPNGLRLSLLVTLCNNKDELQRCLEKTFEVLDDVYLKESGTGTPSLLIEEFIVGELFSVDAYISPSGEITCVPPIRTITAHDKGLEGFYGCEFIVPVNLSDKEIEKAYETSKSAIRALNLRSCTAHVELYKCKNNVWKIVELGPRIGGHRDELYGGAYGIDHYYNDLASRIGLELELPKSLNKYVSCLGVYPDSEGEIVSIDGTSEALDIPSVDSVDLKMQPGDLAVFANNGGRSAVHASLSNDSAQDLLSDIEKIRNTIKIRTK